MSRHLILLLWFGLAGLVLFAPIPLHAGQPAEHHLNLKAESFAFEPAVIRVNEGDRVILDLESLDVTHGVYVDGYQAEAVSEPGRTARIEFTADRVGKFKYRCSIACGTMHPFMIGELVVEPNIPYWRGIALALLGAVGAILHLWHGDQTQPAAGSAGPLEGGKRFDLTSLPLVNRFLRWRGFQPALMLITLLGFVVALLTSFFGTPVGSKNFAIVYVWIVWWALLKVVLVPLAGRLWCTMCPIPAPGEWLQRKGILVKREGKSLTLGRRWPHRLASPWLQNASLLAVTLFSPLILTVPLVSGIVLLAFVLLATILSLVFDRRAFCRYVCPVGGFVGLYATVAPLELRVKDRAICREHRAKECYLGSQAGHGCPWLVQPWRLERSVHCGLCTECLKTCPKDNIALNLRPFGSDLLVRTGRNLGEAFTALIMLTSVLVYSAIFLGPWAWLKDWSGDTSVSGKALYAVAFLAINLVLMPGLLLFVTALSRGLRRVRDLSLMQSFVNQAYALVPMGLSMWIAFSFSFLSVSGSYAVSVLSDPFGWGWDLFGTRAYPWTPYLTHVLPYLQTIALIVGLVASIRLAHRLARQERNGGHPPIQSLIPMAAFLTLVTVAALLLYLG
jgi:polyferredoxin/plastocyanin